MPPGRRLSNLSRQQSWDLKEHFSSVLDDSRRPSPSLTEWESYLEGVGRWCRYLVTFRASPAPPPAQEPSCLDVFLLSSLSCCPSDATPLPAQKSSSSPSGTTSLPETNQRLLNPLLYLPRSRLLALNDHGSSPLLPQLLLSGRQGGLCRGVQGMREEPCSLKCRDRGGRVEGPSSKS